MVSYSSAAGASESSSTSTVSMPTSSQSFCFIETYVSLAGSSLISTVASAGVTPSSSSVEIASPRSSRIDWATSLPSIISVIT